MNRLRG